jgi:hypothetical protein
MISCSFLETPRENCVSNLKCLHAARETYLSVFVINQRPELRILVLHNQLPLLIDPYNGMLPGHSQLINNYTAFRQPTHRCLVIIIHSDVDRGVVHHLLSWSYRLRENCYVGLDILK